MAGHGLARGLGRTPGFPLGPSSVGATSPPRPSPVPWGLLGSVDVFRASAAGTRGAGAGAGPCVGPRLLSGVWTPPSPLAVLSGFYPEAPEAVRSRG